MAVGYWLETTIHSSHGWKCMNVCVCVCDGDGDGGMFMDAHYSIADLVIFFSGGIFHIYMHVLRSIAYQRTLVFVCVRAREA